NSGVADAPSFAVLLSKPEDRDPMVLAKAMAAARQTPLQDQVIAAKNGWGFLAEKLSEAEAQSFVQTLRSSGIESRAVPTGSVAVLPKAEPATTMESVPTAQLALLA